VPSVVRDVARAGWGRASGAADPHGHATLVVDEEHYIERGLPMLQEAVCRIRLDLIKKGKLIAFPVRA
jgi:hypothetical protein